MVVHGAVTKGVFGTQQTWQDVVGSRALGVTYTNTTDKPIQIMVSSTSGTASIPRVDGVPLPDGGANGAAYAIFSFIVPSGSTYSVTSGTLRDWAELKGINS